MAEMLMTRHLTRHNLEKDELRQIHPEYLWSAEWASA